MRPRPPSATKKPRRSKSELSERPFVDKYHELSPEEQLERDKATASQIGRLSAYISDHEFAKAGERLDTYTLKTIKHKVDYAVERHAAAPTHWSDERHQAAMHFLNYIARIYFFAALSHEDRMKAFANGYALQAVNNSVYFDAVILAENLSRRVYDILKIGSVRKGGAK